MKSELDLLIELLEDEKKSLQSLIEENLKEYEYLNVHHHGEALMQVNGRLHMLNCFKDPFYEKEQQFERLLNRGLFDQDIDLKSYWAKRIAEEKEKIQKLRRQANTYFNDTQNIDNALFDLRDGRFNKLRLSFSHRDGPFHLDFEMDTGQILKISTRASCLVNSDDPDDLETNQLRLFINLGFKAHDDVDMLIYQWDMLGVKDIIAIKTMLSRIIYDIGYVGDEKQATLAYFV